MQFDPSPATKLSRCCLMRKSECSMNKQICGWHEPRILFPDVPYFSLHWIQVSMSQIAELLGYMVVRWQRLTSKTAPAILPCSPALGDRGDAILFSPPSGPTWAFLPQAREHLSFERTCRESELDLGIGGFRHQWCISGGVKNWITATGRILRFVIYRPTGKMFKVKARRRKCLDNAHNTSLLLGTSSVTDTLFKYYSGSEWSNPF